MVLHTAHGPLVYSPALRSYWVRFSGSLPGNVPRVTTTSDAPPPPLRAVDPNLPPFVVPDDEPVWLRIHVTPLAHVSKVDARAFLKAHPTWPLMLAAAPRAWPDVLAPATHAILQAHTLAFHALHDSVVVRRDKEDSGIARFALDKLSMPYVRTLPLVVPLLRAEHVASTLSGLVAADDGAACRCEAETLERFDPARVVYCSACTTFRQEPVTVVVRSVGGDGKTPVEVPMAAGAGGGELRTVCVVGRLTFRKAVADALANFYCADLEKSGRFVVAGTFRCCEALFHLAPLADVVRLGVPPEDVLMWVLRDSLFLRRFDDKVVSWAEYYRITPESLGAGESLSLGGGQPGGGAMGTTNW